MSPLPIDDLIELGSDAARANRITNHIHAQLTPVSSVLVTHNLGTVPSIVVVASNGDEWEGAYEHPDLNHTLLSFGATFSFTAYFNA